MTGREIPTQRIEAFSDGIIAIVITVMVFDLKLAHVPTDLTVSEDLWSMLPKWISYIMSFFMLAIMWISHHQLFHQIRHTDSRLLWLSIHLLFWMSVVPFVTHFIGLNPLLWQASFAYGFVFCMSAVAFTLLRNYVLSSDLLHPTINRSAHARVRNKNRLAIVLYAAAALLSLVAVYISFALFIIVPAMYIIPEKITHIKDN